MWVLTNLTGIRGVAALWVFALHFSEYLKGPFLVFSQLNFIFSRGPRKGVTKREGRATSNGLVTAKVAGDLGVMLELNCETDFVAKGDKFQVLADELLNHLTSSKIGELDKFLSSKLVSGKTVQEAIDEGNAVLGEKIEINQNSVLTGSPVLLYLHKTSPDLAPQVGVLVELKVEILSGLARGPQNSLH